MKTILPFIFLASSAAYSDLATVEPTKKTSLVQCPTVTHSQMCYLDIDAGVITSSCSSGLSNDISVVSSTNGLVVEVDMQNWKKLQVGTRIQNPQAYAMNIGNSPSNDGWGGDRSHFSNDSEMHLYNSSVYVYGNDNIGGSLLHSQGGAVPTTGLPVIWATICDGYFNWYAYEPISNQGNNFTVTDSVGLFQIDGNEYDQNPNGNDTKLYIGLERTIANTSRTGGNLVVAPSGDSGEGVDVQLILSR